MKCLISSGAVAAIMLAAGATAGAQTIEVIYTKAAGHPKAVVPGAVDLSGNPATTEFRAMEDLVVSDDGARWIIKGRTQLGSDLETIMLVGSGTTGTRLAQEGNFIPGGGPDERYDFFGSGVGAFDSTNRFAFSARARTMATGSTSAANGQRVLLWDGANITLQFKQNDPITGLLDVPPNPSGDETFGNSVGSIHLLDNGTIGSHDTTINNISSTRRPALMYNSAAFRQSNVSTFTGIDGVTTETWATFSSNAFYTTPDGAHWMAQGRAVSQASSATVLVRDDQAVLATGATIPGSSVVVDAIFAWRLLNSGTWYARGDVVGDNDWAVKNGVVVAKTGDPITTGATETWGAVFNAFAGNNNGDWVLAGTTDNADPAVNEVLVLNGTTVLAREGDPVDLDGNGMFDDDAFIGRGNNTLSAFEANDLYISDTGMVHFFANLRNGAGVDLNSSPSFGTPQAFMRIQVSLTPACPADFNNSGSITVQDIFDFLAAYFAGDLAADFNGVGGLTVQDIFDFLAAYFTGCP
jgi:hypothetical protein